MKNRGRRILNAIIHNWPAKALSLAAAVILFQFYRVNTLDTRALSVPLHIENSGSLVAVNNYAKTVKVTLRGNRKQMDPITENDIEVFLDLLYCAAPGSYTLPVGITMKGNALNVDPLEVITDPPSIKLELDEKESKTVPVKALLAGGPPQGYELLSTQISPESVQITGPQSMLKKTAELFTETVNLDGRTAGFSVQLRIVNKEPLIDIAGHKTVEFSAAITAVLPGKRLDNIALSISNLQPGFRAETNPQSAAVLIRAARNVVIPPLEAADVLLTVDCTGLGEGTHTLPLAAHIQKLPPPKAAPPSPSPTMAVPSPTPAVPADTPAAPSGTMGADSQEQQSAGMPAVVVSILPEYVEVFISKDGAKDE